MKKISILFLLCLTSLFSYSQKLKVDLDRETLRVNYVKLPTKPVLDFNDRTFSIKANGPKAMQLEDNIIIQGFEKVNAGGTIDVQIDVENVLIDKVDIVKREVVKKDKDGKVTSRTYYYKPVISYTTRGFYYTKDQTGNTGRNRLGKSGNSFTGKEYSRYRAAQDYYNNNKYTFKNNFTKKFTRDIINTINNTLNRKYGYVVANKSTILWILDSKKNPEYKAHKKALADIREAFSEMKFDRPVDNIKEKIKPIVAYFESVIPKYNEVKPKKHRKMRYASFYNIAEMYYYLDMPDEAIIYARKIIDNNYDKKDGERMIKSCNRLKEQFKKNKINTRHFPVETIDNRHSERREGGEQVIEEKPIENSVKKVFLEAYLVTKKNDTIDGSVQTLVSEGTDESDVKIPSINKYVKLLVLNDGDDNVSVKKYYAKDVKSLVINNVLFESVYFTSAGKEQASGNVVNLDNTFKGASSHFCRVIYKSDKIGVYAFQNELVLKKPADKKGSSTSSMGYVIAFKKKLSKYVQDCKELVSQIKDGEFQNTADSLGQLAKEYTENCNTN